MVPTKSASDELFNLGLNLEDVIIVLNEGYDCKRSRRKKNIVERCLDKRNKTIKVVLARIFFYSLDEEIWHITHVGITSKKR